MRLWIRLIRQSERLLFDTCAKYFRLVDIFRQWTPGFEIRTVTFDIKLSIMLILINYETSENTWTKIGIIIFSDFIHYKDNAYVHKIYRLALFEHKLQKHLWSMGHFVLPYLPWSSPWQEPIILENMNVINHTHVQLIRRYFYSYFN